MTDIVEPLTTLTSREKALVLRALDYAIAWEEMAAAHQVLPMLRIECLKTAEDFKALQATLRPPVKKEETL